MHLLDGRLGTVNISVPSFAVLALRTVENLFSPSVESEILTLAQFTGAPDVPATFQVTVCIDPVVHTTAVFGAAMLNGPLVPLTVNVEVAVLMPPPPARLSRATTWKVIVRPMLGRISPVKKPPVVVSKTSALFEVY